MGSEPVQALIDVLDGQVFALDADLRYTAFNTAHAAGMRALYGADIAPGGRLLDYQTVPADRERARVNLERALAGERMVDEAPSGGPGSERWFESVYTPIRDAVGTVVGVGVCATDVTEHRQARRTLAESEALFRSILDASPDAMGLTDLDGHLRFMSSAGLRMFGDVGGEEQRSIVEFVAPEDRERVAADMARILRGAPWGPVEYQALRADGDTVPVEVSAALTFDAAGRPAGVVFDVRDITESRRIRDALVLSEDKFRIAFRTSPDAVCLNRLSDGLYLDVSDGFTESTGYTQEDVEGRTSSELRIWYDPEDRRRLVRALEADGVAHGVEMSFRRKDGTVGAGLMSARVIDIGGETCILSITRDISEREEMEAALKESEDRFRYVFEYSPIGKSITSLDGEIHVNRAFCRMLGYSQDELEHMHWQDISPAEDAPAVQAKVDPLLAGECEEVRFERRYLHKDGSIVWADVAIVLRRDEDGTPRYFVVSITDVTDRKRIEDSLRAALAESRRLEAERRLLSDTIEASLNEIYIFAADTLRFLFVNEGARRNLGYSEPELMRMTPVDIKPEFTTEAFVALLQPLVTRRQPQLVFRTVHRRADGSQYPVEVHLQLFDRRPDPVFLAVIQDITDRERAEQALAASEEKWRRILIDTPQIGVSLDREGRIVFANRHFLDLTGWTEQEVLGQDWFDLCIPPDVREEVRGVFGTVMREQSMEGLYKHENEILTKDGGRLGVAWSNVASHDVHGAVVEVTSLGIDITELRRAEDEVRRLNADLERRVVERTAQLEAVNRELEAFAYSVSHDLRAPLRAIDGFSAIVLEDAAEYLRAEDLEHLARVRAGAQRMGLLIDEILALSRATRLEMHVDEVDITRCAEEILAELAEAEPARRVETVVAPGLHARADATLLRVILVNLLSNAWKFTGKHESARIEVGVADADGERAFFVRDDGAGFNIAHATRLFGVFQRMHGPGEFEGEGIGLATVQRLVARHGGRVWAEAEVEKGATFYFTLPGVDPALEPR